MTPHTSHLTPHLLSSARIYIAGHRGLVGSALMRRFQTAGYTNLVTRTHRELDLTDQSMVREFFQQQKPEYVLLAAAKVGGILANDTYPAEFIRENLAIQTHVIHEAWRTGVKRLLFLGSSCIYPRDCPQPMKEEYLLTGPLEQTNRAYAVAKIAGIEMCRSYNRQYGARYLAVMPTNLYGPGDNFDLQNSHVLPALIRKMHEAKLSAAPTVTVWGTGTPRRELLHSDDLADACLFLMNRSDADFDVLLGRGDSQLSPKSLVLSPALINVGCGEDVTIRELAETVQRVIGYPGSLVFDTSKPDGTPRKLLDVSRLNALGWTPRIGLAEGIAQVYRGYLEQTAAQAQ
jgi:GDP-L-fucose synthase